MPIGFFRTDLNSLKNEYKNATKLNLEFKCDQENSKKKFLEILRLFFRKGSIWTEYHKIGKKNRENSASSCK
jgi:hypothetical protein